MPFKVRIAASLSCAILAVVFMAGYTASVRGEAAEQRAGALERYGGETATICVAVRDIARGETFSERNVAAQEWLVDLLPEGAQSDLSSLLGKAAASSIAGNTPIASVDVDVQGDPLDVPAGCVAVSVPCSNESAVGGALTAGTVVDAYVVAGDAARLLCQGVQVLKTNADGTAANLSWATLAIDPAQVEAVIASSSVQRLYFTLPSPEEIDRRANAGEVVTGAGTAALSADVPPVVEEPLAEQAQDQADYVYDQTYQEGVAETGDVGSAEAGEYVVDPAQEAA